jgi:hypothetical protein
MDMPVSTSLRPVGRPKGAPSTVVNLRLPLALVDKLDRYADRMNTHTGPPVNRATITRQALVEFLAQHAPDVL